MLLLEVDSHTHPSPEERRASVEKIVRESGGRAPRGVRLIGFRKATPDEIAYAETIRPRAKAALARDASKRQAAA